ncbi:fatty acid--CoA ligase family protein [Xenorhabdus bovienii]|uniref:ANL family adenylate-forming protein n=1 Tax=Xenorhabdus bovienii TaxID=40576 RepID=UPI0023B22D97|nr:fatty acid--CoA ligase family protein [Xenorhabdus bovienii]MDE9482409.1 fatty acid--CoA ligase family protein [Xenorhabdus bovienii]MDE9556285.1 fatty acid--CoA ligase family protein [Xenorhabdus bovienii]
MKRQSNSRSWLIERLLSFSSRTALKSDYGSYDYAQISHDIAQWEQIFSRQPLAGKVVIVNGDFSARAISALLALYLQQAILVPLHQASHEKIAQVAAVVQADLFLDAEKEEALVALPDAAASHPMLNQIRASQESGLILLSSGSTGVPKAMLLSMDRLLAKQRAATSFQSYVTAALLLFDHIGGFNTLIHCLCNGGTLVHLPAKDPLEVCERIARHGIELLPTTPTFLNMLLIKRAWEHYDLSSLKLMTYGTEVMPGQTLTSIAHIFPQVRLKQTYGMSELGILPTRSQSNDSLWLKIGGEGVEVKIIDDVLWVKSATAMLGYLNAPSPFDDEGWLCTQDIVEVHGEYLRILGRRQEIINVAGLKVLPVEIEEKLLTLPMIAEVSVWPKKNPVTGFVVAATITLHPGTEESSARKEILEFCRMQMASWQAPRFIHFDVQPQVSERLKKIRVKSE